MKRAIVGSGTAVLLAMAWAGCGSSSSSTTATSTSASSSSSTSTGAGGSGPHSIPCDGQPSELSLEGTWVAYGKLAVSLIGAPGGAITPCPSDQMGDSSMLLMLTMTQDKADPKKLPAVHATLCSLELPVVTALVGTCDPASKSLVSAQIIPPASLLSSLPDVATTPVAGTLSATKPGSDVSLDRLLVTVGSSKSGAMMPAWDTSTPACQSSSIGHNSACDATCVADCAALRDDDKDGFPGVTVDVCGYTQDDMKKGTTCHADAPNTPGVAVQGRAFIDIEVDPQLAGTAKSSCELEGKVDTNVRYNLVGSDIWLTGTPIGVTSAIKSLPSFSVAKDTSAFRVVRVDGKFGAPDFMLDPSQPIAACKTITTRINEIQ